LLHTTENDLHLYLMDRLSPGQAVLTNSHLAGCGSCASRVGEMVDFICKVQQGRSMSHVTLAQKDRRCELRFPVNDPVFVQVIEPFSEGTLRGRIVDVSKSGLRLSLRTAVLPGSLVKVRLALPFAFCQVRHYSQRGEEFHIGVTVQEVFGVSRQLGWD
jgi:anti-sigma factor RsiW